jgi:hypothetical protein
MLSIDNSFGTLQKHFCIVGFSFADSPQVIEKQMSPVTSPFPSKTSVERNFSFSLKAPASPAIDESDAIFQERNRLFFHALSRAIGNRSKSAAVRAVALSWANERVKKWAESQVMSSEAVFSVLTRDPDGIESPKEGIFISPTKNPPMFDTVSKETTQVLENIPLAASPSIQSIPSSSLVIVSPEFHIPLISMNISPQDLRKDSSLSNQFLQSALKIESESLNAPIEPSLMLPAPISPRRPVTFTGSYPFPLASKADVATENTSIMMISEQFSWEIAKRRDNLVHIPLRKGLFSVSTSTQPLAIEPVLQNQSLVAQSFSSPVKVDGSSSDDTEKVQPIEEESPPAPRRNSGAMAAMKAMLEMANREAVAVIPAKPLQSSSPAVIKPSLSKLSSMLLGKQPEIQSVVPPPKPDPVVSVETLKESLEAVILSSIKNQLGGSAFETSSVFPENLDFTFSVRIRGSVRRFKFQLTKFNGHEEGNGDVLIAWTSVPSGDTNHRDVAGKLFLSDVSALVVKEDPAAAFQPCPVLTIRIVPGCMAAIRAAGGLLLLEIIPDITTETLDFAVRHLRKFASDLQMYHGRIQMGALAGTLKKEAYI